MEYVLDRIRIDGPQKARDFKSTNNKTGESTRTKKKVFGNGARMAMKYTDF